MRFYLLALGASLALTGLARGDHSDDTLRYYLSKTEACVAGTITSEPAGESSEQLVYYLCDFAVSDVLKGDLKDKTIRVTIVRHEVADADKPPHLKEGAKCILFLKVAKTERPAAPRWETVDLWFGCHPHGPALVRALSRVAGSAEKDETDPPGKFATEPGFNQALYVLKREQAKAERKSDKSPSDTPKLTLKSAHRPQGPDRPWLFVLEGDGGGPIHRAGPEHFVLTRVADGQTVSLFVEYDKETLNEQARIRTQGSPRNPEMRLPAPLKTQYAYNHLFRRVRLFLDTGRHDGKDAKEETGCLDLYGRARLEPGERYRLTWACWPVGARKATEVSVDFQLSDKGPPPAKATGDDPERPDELKQAFEKARKQVAALEGKHAVLKGLSHAEAHMEQDANSDR